MEQNLFIRIILIPNGDTHILFPSKDSIPCTPQNLISILSDPISFYMNESKGCTKTTYYINPQHLSIENIPGLTLLTITKDKTIVCDYPELFDLLFRYVNNSEMEKTISFTEFLKEDTFSDEKQYLLKHYLELTNQMRNEIKIQRHVSVDPEKQIEILRETLNMVLREKMTLPQMQYENSNPTANTEGAALQTGQPEPAKQIGFFSEKKDNALDLELSIPADYIPLTQFALKNGVVRETVHSWIRKGNIHTQIKDDKGNYWIKADETVRDGRRGRSVKTKNDGKRKYITLKKGASYTELQEYIKERKLVTDKVRPFIRTREEMKYYENHRYKEVWWEDITALIIDIQPDYILKESGTTNRELILAGKSPVLPYDEKCHYHLHHIGQKEDSPLAIIPETDHNSAELYSVFHLIKNADKDLHSNEFEALKKRFWNTYLEIYDKYVFYSKIPSQNSRHTKDKR